MLSQQILKTIPQFIRVIRHLSTNQLDGSVTLHHLRILHLVSEGMSQSKMGQILQISLPGISKIVNGLVQKELIQRTPAKDKRCINLKLTMKGKKTLKAVSQEVEQDLNEALKHLSSSECLELGNGIKAIEKLMLHLEEV